MPIVKRRTITLDEYVDQFINTIRGVSIMQGNEMDYTTMINFFAEYGIRKLLENSNDPLAKEVAKKYTEYDELKEYSFYDSWKDFDELREFKKRYLMK